MNARSDVATPTGRALEIGLRDEHFNYRSADRRTILAIEAEAATQERERLRAECAADEHIRRMGMRSCFNCDPEFGLFAEPAEDRQR